MTDRLDLVFTGEADLRKEEIMGMELGMHTARAILTHDKPRLNISKRNHRHDRALQTVAKSIPWPDVEVKRLFFIGAYLILEDD